MPGDPFYWSKEWRDFRASILAVRRQCQAVGCRRQPTHVDHINTRKARPDLAFDSNNVQALCHSCHSAKTCAVDGGFGNRRHDAHGFRPRPKPGASADGIPNDPRHSWNRVR
jgi:5-methylcytosine-specific restriction endonuclease McrA